MTAPLDRGELGDRPALELVGEFAARSVTGKLHLSDGRRRWYLFFEDGKLVFSQSNLKSEQLKALKEQAPDAEARALLNLQAVLRLMNISAAADGEWTFTDGEAAPKRRPVDVAAACWQAIQRKVPPTDARARLESDEGEFPVLKGGGRFGLDDLPLGGDARQLLRDLDGQRHLSDVLDFAPADAPLTLYLAWILGAVGFESRSASVGEVRATGMGRRAQEFSQEVDLLEGIGALIAEQTGRPTEIVHPPPQNTDPEVAKLQAELERLEGSENEFEVLGVSWDDDEQGYRTTYFQLAREYHPDRWLNKPTAQADLAEQILARINQAWEILGESESREAYIDRIVHGIKSEDELAMEKVQAILAAENDFKVGMQHFQSNRIVQAHEIFERISLAVPEEHEFKAYYGYTTYQLNKARNPNKAEEGADLIKAAIDQAPKLQSAWVLMGQVYNDKGLTDMAKRCFVQTLKLNPTHPEATRELNRMKRQSQQQQQQSSGIGGWLSGLFGRKKS